MDLRYSDFIPKSYVCFKEGYSRQYFFNDLFAGISVGIIALPLAIAFAIASGVLPEKGLFTAIIAGFLISLLGGSRVQIGGPTGAFVVIVYTIVKKYGYDGLVCATLIASFLMILMGLLRFGSFLKFIPYPVTTGFTTGIALVIFSSQMKDFFGLKIDNTSPEIVEQYKSYFAHAHTFTLSAFVISFSTLIFLFVVRRFSPKVPGAIFAILVSTLAVYFFQLPVDTIETKFGEIPRMLPAPSFPQMSFELIRTIFPEAITIAILGGIESLLSAVVADGMTGHKHRSNGELCAQGIANIGSIMFGGIPATGAIARTSANIRLGAKTPMAGMIHAITLLLLMLFFAPLAGKIPLCALSGILVFVAWNMSELSHFIEIAKGQKGDASVLLSTFLLTVFIDLTVAIQIGVLLAAIIFLKRMTDKSTVEVCKILVHENENETLELNDSDILFRKDVPNDIAIFEIRGPFFYSIADSLDEALLRLNPKPRVFILRINKTPLIDATGINAIKKFGKKCKQKGVLFLISGVNSAKLELFRKSSIQESIGIEHIFHNVESALSFAKKS